MSAFATIQETNQPYRSLLLDHPHDAVSKENVQWVSSTRRKAIGSNLAINVRKPIRTRISTSRTRSVRPRRLRGGIIPKGAHLQSAPWERRERKWPDLLICH